MFWCRGVRFVGHHLLTVRTPIGRKIRPNFLARATPLIRVKPKDFTPAGVTRVGRIVDVRDGFPVTEDAQTIDVTNIIWCTGHRPGFSWIDLPIMGDRQEPNTSVAWFRRNSAFTSSTAIRGA